MIIKVLLLSLAVATFNLFGNTGHKQEKNPAQTLFYNAARYTPAPLPKPPMKTLAQIKAMLETKAPNLSQPVIQQTMRTLRCADARVVEHNNILTIIDFSLPSNQKRIWIFDLAKGKLLFHTYVSHGIKSGSKLSNYFSNKRNSKASSIGVFNTEKSYYGRHGFSLKLLGLERNINHNAYNRFIVMHGSWYVNEAFIKKYGRAGRSWGCPSLPIDLTRPIIETIRGKTLLVAYYPSDQWFSQSSFINCPSNYHAKPITTTTKPLVKEKEMRGAITYVDLNNNAKREENEPVVAISADNYKKIFDTKPPLKRMLRRRINNEEYIVLNNTELAKLDSNNDRVLSASDINGLKNVYFVIPVVKKLRGYWATEMKPIFIGNIVEVSLDKISPNNESTAEKHQVKRQGKSPVFIRSTNRFIRWLGL